MGSFLRVEYLPQTAAAQRGEGFFGAVLKEKATPPSRRECDP
jgi:hypothetical protein